MEPDQLALMKPASLGLHCIVYDSSDFLKAYMHCVLSVGVPEGVQASGGLLEPHSPVLKYPMKMK